MSEVQIPEVVRNLADKMKKNFKVGTGGVVEVPDDLYESTLEDAGLDMKTIKKVQDHNTNVLCASGLALGEVGMNSMKKDKKLEQVSVSFKAGKDTISSSFQRSKEVPVNAPGEPRKTTVKHGVMNNSYTTWGAGNKGTLKKVRQHLSDEAAKILGS